MNNGNWEVGYFAAEQGGGAGRRRPAHGHRSVNRGPAIRSPGRWRAATPGAFGHKLDAPYVFLPLCALFLLGLVDWRRRWRIANLDLLVLLGFGVSYFFFNRAEIGVSVPLQYPPLLYLLARALWIGFRGRGEGIRPVWPAAWLLIAALFLIGFRVGLNVADSGVIDVGYAGVVGADRIAHGEPIYGNFPKEISQGDTYGPVNYYAYVPFERIWPWSGTWNDLPAAHAAAVFFDLAHLRLPALARHPDPPRTGGPEARRHPRLWLGRLPLHRVSRWSRTPTTRWWRCCWWRRCSCSPARWPAARWRPLRPSPSSHPLVLVPMLATYRPQPTDGVPAPDPPGIPRAALARFTLSPSSRVSAAGDALGRQSILASGPSMNEPSPTRRVANSPFSIWGQVPPWNRCASPFWSQRRPCRCSWLFVRAARR